MQWNLDFVITLSALKLLQLFYYKNGFLDIITLNRINFPELQLSYIFQLNGLTHWFHIWFWHWYQDFFNEFDNYNFFLTFWRKFIKQSKNCIVCIMLKICGTLDTLDKHKFSSWDAQWKYTAFSFSVFNQTWAAGPLVFPGILPAPSNVKPEYQSTFIKQWHIDFSLISSHGKNSRSL